MTTRAPVRARPAPTARIDPRIRARRVEVTRAAGRKRLRRILIVLGVVALAASALGIVVSPLLDVDRVAVVGGGARAAEIRAAAAIHPGAPLLLVDTGAVAGRVEGLSWIADARVSRDLPGTLRIVVRLRPPVAFAGRPDGRVAVVDPSGMVVALIDTAPGGLPALVTTSVPPGPGHRIAPRAAARVAGALGPLTGRVARISVDHAQAALLLTDGTEVRLGGLDHVQQKSRAADAVLAALPARVVYVDVRVPSAPVTG
jgi:cell division protein FtsQ